MKQHFTDRKTGIEYTLQEDYYRPNFLPVQEEQQPIGVWGQRHLRYIRRHRRLLYTNLLTNGKLNEYLANINKQAED